MLYGVPEQLMYRGVVVRVPMKSYNWGHWALTLEQTNTAKKINKFLNIAFLLSFCKFLSRVLFHCLFLSSISTIYLCDLPITAPDLHQDKTGRLNYRNLFGLSTPEVYPA